MSLVSLRKCPIEICKFHNTPVPADKSQIKKHIRYDHDYTEKLEAAVKLGIIKDITERRSPDYLTQELSEYTILKREWI